VLRAGVGHLGVDAAEQADAQIAIEIVVVAARLGWGGLGARARLRGRVGARGAIAADAVAQHGHDGDVEREAEQAEQAEQCGVDQGAFFGGEGVGRGFPIGLGGLWREGDWRVPEGGCGLHVPYSFYMGQESGRRKGFFASGESFFAAVGDRAGGGSAASTACFGFSVPSAGGRSRLACIGVLQRILGNGRPPGALLHRPRFSHGSLRREDAPRDDI
jgi:hypothetical protein